MAVLTCHVPSILLEDLVPICIQAKRSRKIDKHLRLLACKMEGWVINNKVGLAKMRDRMKAYDTKKLLDRDPINNLRHARWTKGRVWVKKKEETSARNHRTD